MAIDAPGRVYVLLQFPVKYEPNYPPKQQMTTERKYGRTNLTRLLAHLRNESTDFKEERGKQLLLCRCIWQGGYGTINSFQEDLNIFFMIFDCVFPLN